jgi:hypothetical protein
LTNVQGSTACGLASNSVIALFPLASIGITRRDADSTSIPDIKGLIELYSYLSGKAKRAAFLGIEIVAY